MKRFKIYKSIRKKAVIFGLPLLSFALLMASVIVSLLIIIFSFSFIAIFGSLLFNGALYAGLLHMVNHPHFYRVGRTFPYRISNQKNTGLHYEEH